jgi:hypothetical protein
MRRRTAGWHLIPAAFAAAVLTFGLAGVASAQAVNQAPTPQNDTVTTAEDTPVVINVLANDTDPDGDTLTLVSVTNGTKGTAAITGGMVTYTPAANKNGSDSFTYTVTDGALQASAVVNVTITPVNDAPVAVNDTATVKKDTATVIDVLKNDSDVDGDALTVISVSTPAHGAVVISNEGKKVTYTPASGYLGNDTFTYVISDGTLTAAASVSITVVEKTGTPGTSAEVQAACQAYSGMDGGLTALCGLYLGTQLPAWAQENIGQVILKRTSKMNKAEIICSVSTTDATLTALCGIYNDPAAPGWLKKSLGGMVEQYVKASTSSSIEVEKNKGKEHGKKKD